MVLTKYTPCNRLDVYSGKRAKEVIMGIAVSAKKVEIKDLVGLDLFAGVDEKDLKDLASLCHIENIEKNTVIHPAGCSTDDVYFLTGKNDAVQIELPIEGFNTVVTNVLGKGQLFGWCSLVPVQLRTTQARCIDDTEVIAFKGNDLLKLLDKNNRLGYTVMKNFSSILCSRLTYTSVSLRYLVRQLTKSDQNWRV